MYFPELKCKACRLPCQDCLKDNQGDKCTSCVYGYS